MLIEDKWLNKVKVESVEGKSIFYFIITLFKNLTCILKLGK